MANGVVAWLLIQVATLYGSWKPPAWPCVFITFARIVVNANHSTMWRAVKCGLSDCAVCCVADAANSIEILRNDRGLSKQGELELSLYCAWPIPEPDRFLQLSARHEIASAGNAAFFGVASPADFKRHDFEESACLDRVFPLIPIGTGE